MVFNSSMDDMKPDDTDLTFEKILNALLDGKHNLDLKTRINKPKQLAGLKIIENVLRGANYKISSGIIDKFTKKYLRYMVSYKGLSRKEIIRALSEPRKEIEAEKSKFTKKLN